jgi:glycosyltransferase involved in cell wall biosynthesis
LANAPVSVIIPAYDEGERLPVFLRELVGRALATARPRLELIVVDDGSAPEHARAQYAAVTEAAEVLREAGWADTGSSHVLFGVDAAKMAWGLRTLRRRMARADPRPVDEGRRRWRDVA